MIVSLKRLILEPAMVQEITKMPKERSNFSLQATANEAYSSGPLLQQVPIFVSASTLFTNVAYSHPYNSTVLLFSLNYCRPLRMALRRERLWEGNREVRQEQEPHHFLACGQCCFLYNGVLKTLLGHSLSWGLYSPFCHSWKHFSVLLNTTSLLELSFIASVETSSPLITSSPTPGDTGCCLAIMPLPHSISHKQSQLSNSYALSLLVKWSYRKYFS